MGIFFHHLFSGNMTSEMLTALLLVTAGVTISIALVGNPLAKALVAAWLLLP
jgi:hypothetical protein